MDHEKDGTTGEAKGEPKSARKKLDLSVAQVSGSAVAAVVAAKLAPPWGCTARSWAPV
ncbi:hypothetical protein [Streptomyces sp. ISL-36]|uniref:hypothetical protein n=1 Tax=Streptomyces sp. ISL-36 TaxID=2819182 RepID=UPI0027E56B22|nr:hypothetical protein [Streptomyces sp. ISL-36]